MKPERFAELDPDKVAAIEKSFFIGQPYPYSFEANSLATILAEALEIRKRSIETGSKTNEYWLSEFSGGLERGDSLGKVAKLSAFFETVKKSDVDTLAAARSGGSELIFFSRYSSGNSS